MLKLNKGAREYFRIPADYKQHYSSYNGISFSTPPWHVIFAMVPLNRLKAAGVPSDIGEHLHRMIKVLRRQKVPPIAVRIASNGQYVVEDGNTRVLALKRIGIKGKVPAVVASFDLTALERLEPF